MNGYSICTSNKWMGIVFMLREYMNGLYFKLQVPPYPMLPWVTPMWVLAYHVLMFMFIHLYHDYQAGNNAWMAITNWSVKPQVIGRCLETITFTSKVDDLKPFSHQGPYIYIWIKLWFQDLLLLCANYNLMKG